MSARRPSFDRTCTSCTSASAAHFLRLIHLAVGSRVSSADARRSLTDRFPCGLRNLPTSPDGSRRPALMTRSRLRSFLMPPWGCGYACLFALRSEGAQLRLYTAAEGSTRHGDHAVIYGLLRPVTETPRSESRTFRYKISVAYRCPTLLRCVPSGRVARVVKPPDASCTSTPTAFRSVSS